MYAAMQSLVQTGLCMTQQFDVSLHASSSTVHAGLQPKLHPAKQLATQAFFLINTCVLDRQVYGGVVYMDFDEASFKQQGHGRYRHVPIW